jgi:hypothetical protein
MLSELIFVWVVILIGSLLLGPLQDSMLHELPRYARKAHFRCNFILWFHLKAHEFTKLLGVLKSFGHAGAYKRVLSTEGHVLTLVHVWINKCGLACLEPLVTEVEAEGAILVETCSYVSITHAAEGPWSHSLASGLDGGSRQLTHTIHLCAERHYVISTATCATAVLKAELEFNLLIH